MTFELSFVALKLDFTMNKQTASEKSESKEDSQASAEGQAGSMTEDVTQAFTSLWLPGMQYFEDLRHSVSLY